MSAVAAQIAELILRWHVAGEPLILGLCGPQGCGKSTAAAEVVVALKGQGLCASVLSLDDLYLCRDAREALARKVHPLFATRGPPGTHDVLLGQDVMDAVRAGEPIRLPRYSKARDAALPRAEWPWLENCDVLIFEGWCVGAVPQKDAALADPINALERDEDPNGVWRRTVNAYLGGEIGTLFAQLDRLIYIQPPNFEIIVQWRCEQEHRLIDSGSAPAAMNDEKIAHFVAHFERLTRHIMVDMPRRADHVIRINSAREVVP
jgi:D-glycerate 3-kinase